MPSKKKKRTITRKTRASNFELLLMGRVKPSSHSSAPHRAGDKCPQCGKGRLDYNGVLALECPVCGYTSTEGGGCT
ncbi:MAG: hypothetical protein M1282_07590 [Chloroflexi bacterium]|nr:hypothetical protein [Chloroflexota bacterium]